MLTMIHEILHECAIVVHLIMNVSLWSQISAIRGMEVVFVSNYNMTAWTFGAKL